MDGKPSFKWVGSRRFARPDEDLEDQGLGFDVGTLLERRKMLSVLGLGAAGLTLSACGAGGSSSASASGSASASATASATASGLEEIPDETAGPYPGDGSNGPDVLEESGIVRSDITSSFGDASGTATGIPLTVDLTILDLVNGGAGFAGAAVYAWHCDDQGRYSMYTEGIEDENFLRGVQIADEQGRVRFTTVFPGCYSGRWPHIHFEVYPDQASITDSANAIAISQLALPQNASSAVYATSGYESSVANLAAISLTSDTVFGDDGGALQMAAVSGDVESGYSATLTAAVDTSTEPTGGMASGGAPGGGGPGGGEPPSGAPGN